MTECLDNVVGAELAPGEAITETDKVLGLTGRW